MNDTSRLHDVSHFPLTPTECADLRQVFNPHLKVQSDADALRDAKLEAMGLPPEMDTRGYIKERDNRREMATDEQASYFMDLMLYRLDV